MAVIVPPVELYGGLIPRYYDEFYWIPIRSITIPYHITYHRPLRGGTGSLDVYVDDNFTRQTEAGGRPVAQGRGVVMLHDLPVFLVANLPAGEDPEATRRTLRDRLQRFGQLLTELAELDTPSLTSVLGEAFLRSPADPVLLIFAVAAGWLFAAEAGLSRLPARARLPCSLWARSLPGWRRPCFRLPSRILPWPENWPF